MVTDLASSATYELKERITSRDGEKPIAIVKDVLATYLPQDDNAARNGFVRTITDNPELYSVWKTAPKGKKLLLDSSTSMMRTADSLRVVTAANKSIKDIIKEVQERRSGTQHFWTKDVLLNAVLTEMNIKDEKGRPLKKTSTWYRRLEELNGKSKVVEMVAKDYPNELLKWANTDKDDIAKAMNVKREKYGIKKHVPVRVGTYVVCNTNTINKPIFLIGKIVLIRGNKTNREALVEFADKSLGFKGHVLYPAFSESALGIVAFANVRPELSYPPFPPLGKPGVKFHDAALLHDAPWVSDQALSLYVSKRYTKLVAAIRKRKKMLYDVVKVSVREEAKIEEVDAHEPGTPIPVRDDDWMAPLAGNIKKKLKKSKIKPVEKRLLENMIELKLPMDAIETGDEGEGEFGLSAKVFGKTVWISAQYGHSNPEGEWDVVDYFSPDDIYVADKSLDVVVDWLQKAAKGLIGDPV